MLDFCCIIRVPRDQLRMLGSKERGFSLPGTIRCGRRGWTVIRRTVKGRRSLISPLPNGHTEPAPIVSRWGIGGAPVKQNKVCVNGLEYDTQPRTCSRRGVSRRGRRISTSCQRRCRRKGGRGGTECRAGRLLITHAIEQRAWTQ